MPKFYTSIDLNKNQLQYASIHPSASVPAGSTAAGQIYFDTNSANTSTYNRLIIRNAVDGAWISIPYSGSIVNADIDNSAGITVTKLLTSGANAVTLSSIGAPTTSVAFNSQSITGVNAITTSGNVTVGGDLTVNGNTTTLNTTDLVVEDKNIVIANVETPTNSTANDAGITIKGQTDKLFRWLSSTSSFTSSENIDLASGKTYKINGTDVLSSTAIFGKTFSSGSTVATKYAGNITHNGSTVSFTVTHNLNTTDITTQVFETSAGIATNQVYCDITVVDSNSISVIFGAAESSGTVYRVVVTG